MRGSVLAKMIGLYMLMAFMFLGVVGSVLLEACRKEISNVRIELLSSRASAVVRMAVQFDDPDDYIFQGFLQSIANEFDAVIQIYDEEGNFLCGTSSALFGLSVPEDENAKLDEGLLNKLLQNMNNGSVYIRADYFSPKYSSRYSTVAVAADMPNSETHKRIAVMHSDESVIYDSYYKIMSGIWVPLAAVLIFSIILIIMMNYRMVLPLTQMNAAAKAIANGNFSKRIYVKTRDEVGQLAKSFNKMAEELASTDTMRKDFVANVSHELRSPLTSITGFVQGMLDGTIPESEYKKYLEIVLAESQRLSRLTKEMLDLTRIESGNMPLHKTVFDINELIRRVIITKEHALENRQLDLDIAFKEEKINVYADQGGIEQVLVNLLDNAIKFTPPGGEISISSCIKEGRAAVAIKDTGAGIKQDILPHIWERFYTENKSRTGSKGVGLGLSIVKRIMVQHGQDITAQSKEGEGSTFTFTLELAPKGKSKTTGE